MPKKIEDIIDVTSADFQKEFKDQIITFNPRVTPGQSNQKLVEQFGNDFDTGFFGFRDGQFQKLGDINSDFGRNIRNNFNPDQIAQLDPFGGGLQSGRFTSGQTSDLFKFFKTSQDDLAARTQNFGMGDSVTPEQAAENARVAALTRQGGVNNSVQTADIKNQGFLARGSSNTGVAGLPGNRISSPEQLQGLNESDLARTTGDAIYRRDLAAEQAALSDYASQHGAPKSDTDWRKFHEFVYEGKHRTNQINGASLDDTAITSDLLSSNQDRIDLGGITSKQVNPQTTLAEGQQQLSTLDQFIKDLTPQAPSENKQRQTQILNRVDELLGQTQGRQEDINQAENEAGVTELRNNLNNLKNELSLRLASFQKEFVEIEGKPISMSSIIGQQAQAKAQAQADIMFLEARISAMQNNVTFAEETVDRAINAKYAPIFEELEIKQAQLQSIQPFLDDEEKTLSIAREQLLNEQARQIGLAYENDKAIQSITLQAIQNGIVDQNVISRIQKSSTPEAAALIMQQNLPEGTTSGETQVIRGAGGRSLLVDTQTGEVLQDFGSATSGGGGGVSGSGGETVATTTNPEIETLANLYLRGEGLGSIGATKKAEVIQRAEQIEKENQVTALSDINILTEQIKLAQAQGDSPKNIREELSELGVPENLWKEAFRRIAQEPASQVEDSFFARLFGGSGATNLNAQEISPTR